MPSKSALLTAMALAERGARPASALTSACSPAGLVTPERVTGRASALVADADNPQRVASTQQGGPGKTAACEKLLGEPAGAGVPVP